MAACEVVAVADRIPDRSRRRNYICIKHGSIIVPPEGEMPTPCAFGIINREPCEYRQCADDIIERGIDGVRDELGHIPENLKG